jgi:hypothetical protein
LRFLSTRLADATEEDAVVASILVEDAEGAIARIWEFVYKREVFRERNGWSLVEKRKAGHAIARKGCCAGKVELAQ